MKKTDDKNEYKPFFFAFPAKLVSGKILSRYKRFLADVQLTDGSIVTAHVANSGSMTTCWEKNARVIMTWHGEDNDRKLKYSLQAVEMPDGLVSVNTMNPNRAVTEAIIANAIPSLRGYQHIQTEVKTAAGSRFDLALYSAQQGETGHQLFSLKPGRSRQILGFSESASPTQPITFIEIKNATLRHQDGVTFPDAVTSRGQKHLDHLIALKKQGFRTIILFFAGRSNTSWVGPARHIDPDYARLLEQALENGVEALAVKVEVSEKGLLLCGEIPVIL